VTGALVIAAAAIAGLRAETVVFSGTASGEARRPTGIACAKRVDPAGVTIFYRSEGKIVVEWQAPKECPATIATEAPSAALGATVQTFNPALFCPGVWIYRLRLEGPLSSTVLVEGAVER